jgi:hypothetical protein
MPRLKFKSPCNDCPYRRVSLKGWLGAATPEDFSLATQSEQQMPCHQTIDYDDQDWQATQYDESAICVGSLIHLRNQAKLPREPDLRMMAAQVQRDPANVFEWPHEFIAHHRSGDFQSWEKQTSRPAEAARQS